MAGIIPIFIIEISSVILCFIYIICSFFCYSKYSLNNSILSYFYNNWFSNPIIDLKIDEKKNSNKCSDSLYESLISTTFPGFYEGCTCVNSENIVYKKKIYNQSCTENQIKENCENVNEMDDQQIIWKNSNLCVKRNRELNYFKIVESTISGIGDYKLRLSCGKKEISCGTIDTLGNLLCVQDENLCPYNYIDFKSNLDKDSITDENKIEMLTLNDYEKNPLYYGSIYSGKRFFDKNWILNQFIVNDHKICSISNEGIFGMNNFTLCKLKGKSDCEIKGKSDKEFDNRYNLLDTEEGEEFYRNNKLDKILNNIEGYYYNEENDIRLYSMNYFGIKYECLQKNIKGDNFEFYLADLIDPKVKNGKIIIFVLAIISLTYFLFLIVQMNFIFIKNIKMIGFEIGKAIFVLVIFGLSCASFYQYNKHLKTYNLLVKKNNCFDDYSIKNFELGYKPIRTCIGYFIAILVLSLLDFLFKIFGIFFF